MSGVAEPRGDGDAVADEVLLQRFIDGDHAAFEALVARHRDRVFAICRRWFRDPADVQDAAQETFLALHRGAASFTGAAKLSTWLHRVATNACHDIVRKRERRPQTAAFDPDWLADDRDLLDRVELDVDLREALSQLTPEHREAVVLHTVQGWTYIEIAERTGSAVGTIKSRVHRGLAHMARHLADQGVDGGPVQPSGPAVHQSKPPPEGDR